MYAFDTRLAINQADEHGNQTLVSILDMMQACTHFWYETEPGFAQYIEDNGIAMMLVSRQVDVYTKARHGEHLQVRSGIYDGKGCFGYRNTAIYGADGSAYAKSWAVGVFVSRATGKPFRLSEDALKALRYEEQLEMEYLPKKISLPQDEFVQHAPIQAKIFDIDFNKHVNNARYIQMACECLPSFGHYTRLRVEHKKAAKLHDTIIPFTLVTPDAAYIRLTDTDLVPYCVIELSTL